MKTLSKQIFKYTSEEDNSICLTLIVDLRKNRYSMKRKEWSATTGDDYSFIFKDSRKFKENRLIILLMLEAIGDAEHLLLTNSTINENN